MAFAQIYVRRDCPQESFPQLEEAVAGCVGEVIYGNHYPDDADVSAATLHGTLGTFAELEVKVDTEDLPKAGWLITDSGLCIPDASGVAIGEITREVPEQGLTEKELYQHHKVQARKITGVVGAHTIWTELIGWRGQLAPDKKLGTLVVKAQGAWHATYSEPQ